MCGFNGIRQIHAEYLACSKFSGEQYMTSLAAARIQYTLVDEVRWFNGA
jgi:hypothetical protein